MGSLLDIDLAWGGFYASIAPENGSISIFRLLDFNRNAYHAALFKERFDTLPTLEHVAAMSPFIGHVPIETLGLLRHRDLTLLGTDPLTKKDLEGYAYYLEAQEVTSEEIDELLEQIIGFSAESPLPLRLEIINEELVISERS